MNTQILLHRDELKLELEKNEKPIFRVQSPFWGPDSRVYPDLKRNEEAELPY